MTLHLLALETSSSICDVAVLSCVDDSVRVFSAVCDQTGRHAERLLPMVDDVLARAGISRNDLDAIAFGQGPGGFTGLRVAGGVAQGLAFGLDVPVVPVSSLLAVAVRASGQPDGAAVRPERCYLVIRDARMDEVYLAAYRTPSEPGQPWEQLQPPVLMNARDVEHWFGQQAAKWGLTPDDPAYVAGDALDAYPFLAEASPWSGCARLAGSLRADASAVAHVALAALRRGEAVSPENALPMYVRDKVAYTTAERQQGAGGNPRAPSYDISIQAMEPKHLDAVAAIEARVQSFPWSHDNFVSSLQAGYSGWVAYRNGQVIGFYIVLLAPDVAHLLIIAVDPDHQGRGVGKLLMDHCQAAAQAAGLDTLVLEVRVSNHKAIGFYRRQGFEPFSVRKDYYPAPHGTREDASVMKKTWSLPGPERSA